MKVMIFEATPNWSGGAQWAYLLSKGLKKLGHEVYVCCFKSSLLYKRCTEFGINTLPVHPTFDLDPFAFLRIFMFAMKYRADVFNICSPKFYWIASFVGQLLRKRVVILRNVPFRKKGLKRQINKLLYNYLANSIITHSTNVKEELKFDFRIPEKKLKVISLPLNPDLTIYEPKDLRKELGVNKDDILIGVIGRVDYNKGYEELFQVIPIINNKIRNIRFLIVGDGPIRKNLEKLRMPNVTFLGFRTDMGNIYRNIDISVVPSSKECGVPYVIKESLLFGVPVVAHDTLDVRSHIENGVNGFLVNVNEIESFTNGLLSAIKHFKEMKGRILNTMTSIEDFINEYTKVINENKV